MISVPPALQKRVFRGSNAIAADLVTIKCLRGPNYRRHYRDFYADSALPFDHRLRCEGAMLLLPEGCVLSGRSAACVRGLPLGEPDELVLVIAPPGTRCKDSVQGIRIREAKLAPEEIRRGRLPTTVPLRTAWEIASEYDLVEAVTGLDVLLRHRYIWTENLAALAAARPRSRGARAIRLADKRAESPQETRLRVRLVLAGLPPPVPQYRIRSNAHFAAKVDLAWPEHRLALEYDGKSHTTGPQMGRDRHRVNRMTSGGWDFYFATAIDLADDKAFAELVAQLKGALGMA